MPKYTTKERVPLTRTTSRWINALYTSRKHNSSQTEYQATINGLRLEMQHSAAKDGLDKAKENARIAELADGFSYEVYSSLYDPEGTKQLGIPAADTEWVQALHEEIEKMPEFESLAKNTCGDPDLSAMAAIQILTSLRGVVGEMTMPEKEKGKKDDGVTAKDKCRAAMRKAAKEAQQDVLKAKVMLNGIAPGLGNPPPLHKQNKEEEERRLALAYDLLAQGNLNTVMECVGRLVSTKKGKKKEVTKYGKSEVYGLELGNDLARMLPQELVNLKHPKLRMLTLAKYADRGLQQYRLRGKEKVGRGPMIILLDQSGSMTNMLEEGAKNKQQLERGQLAAAIAIACVSKAAKEKRACSVVSFARYVNWTKTMDEHGNGLKDLVMEIATSQCSGGTNFERPLNEAFSLKNNPSNEKADFVFITDGNADFPHSAEERLAESKKTGTMLYGVTVGGGSMSATVRSLCDSVVEIQNLDYQDGGINELPY